MRKPELELAYLVVFALGYVTGIVVVGLIYLGEGVL